MKERRTWSFSRRVAVPALLALSVVISSPTKSWAIAGCCCGRSSLLERFESTDVAVFCRRTNDAILDTDEPVWFEATEVLKGAEFLPQEVAGPKLPYRFKATVYGDQPAVAFLAFGFLDPNDVKLEWGVATPLNNRELTYARCIAKFPPDPTGTQRLKLLLPFLDAPEEFIAQDILDTLTDFNYGDLRALSGEVSAKMLREWIAEPELWSSRRALYLKLLSICGDESDLPLVRKIVEGREERDGDGVRAAAIGCYLALGGENALPLFESLYFTADESSSEPADQVQRISDAVDRLMFDQHIYSAIEGLRFASCDRGSISRRRSITAFRRVLDHPDAAAQVVPELARLKDWDSTPRLAELFRAAKNVDADEWNSVRVSIILFLRRSPRPDAAALLREFAELDPAAIRNANLSEQ